MSAVSATTSKLTLLGPASMRPFRCLWMLEELGLQYKHIPKALPQSRFVKKYNPLGKVPVLLIHDSGEQESGNDHQQDSVEQDPSFVLYESAAIVNYLGDNFAATNNNDSIYIPQVGTNERGIYDQTLYMIVSELDSQGLWIHRKHETMGKYFGYIPDAVQHAKEYFNKTNDTLIQQLKLQKEKVDKTSSNNTPNSNLKYYLLGNRFTPVDIFYIHCLTWSISIGWNEQWKNNPIVTKYYQNCTTNRIAYQKVQQILHNEQKQRQQQKTKHSSNL